jgi:UDP-glucose 4-epimerase
MGQKTLITGAFGYLGSIISSSLNKTKNGVILGISHKNDAKCPPELVDCQIKRYDLSSIVSCIELCDGVETIIHTSGMNSTECAKSPKDALRINGMFTANLIEGALLKGVKKIIYFSTAHVYSNHLNGYIDESSSTDNTHPYATSHLAGENQLIWAGHQNPIEIVILRLSNVYGMELVQNSNCWNLFVNDVCYQAVVNQTVYIKSQSDITRNFLPITELCRVINFIAEKKDIKNEIINIGSIRSHTLEGMASLIVNRARLILGITPEIIFMNKGSRELTSLDYSVNKLKGLGYLHLNNFEQEIDNLIIQLDSRNLR